ncbi:YvcK family protein [Candidatus Gottesmanbacteria bacterium]|nr:YvcK family protein [Candidatus Gottesmanbacteria bacterium]
MKKASAVVCLGGGIGTVQVVRSLRPFVENITVVVSMADDGGSAGRLRRLYSVPPPGDLINCLAALSDAEPILQELLTYRFEGNRWGREDSIGGHKIGNLILVALTKILGNFNLALLEAERIFSCKGHILPSTFENVSIWAETTKGEKVIGEEKIDLGKYKDSLSKVHLEPKNVKTPSEVVKAIMEANTIIIGPGDLYTTILPVLLVPDIQKAIGKSKAKKIFVANIANKRETKNYTLNDYLDAFNRHVTGIKFNLIVVNNNQKIAMKPKSKYAYVSPDFNIQKNRVKIVKTDIIDSKFLVQHDPKKLGAILQKILI